MNRRKFLLIILSTTFMIVSGLGVGLWVALFATLLPKLNLNCIMFGTDGPTTSALSNINGNKTVRKERVCGKRSTSERGQENVLVMIFHHHLSVDGRANFMTAITVVLAQFGFKLVVRIN